MDRMLAATVEIEVAGPASTSRVTPPDPEVPAKVQRRRFSAEYRLRILKQADACKKPGEVRFLLRREGLYSSRLTNWRRQREQGARHPRALRTGIGGHLLAERAVDVRGPQPAGLPRTDNFRRLAGSGSRALAPIDKLSRTVPAAVGDVHLKMLLMGS